MGFTDAVKSVLTKYVGFSGRATRSEYWYWILFYVLISFATSILDVVVFPGNSIGPLNMLLNIALFLPALAVLVRRLHDIGRSGWWWLIMLIPIIGLTVLFVWLATRSEAGDNRFGPSPHQGIGANAVPA